MVGERLDNDSLPATSHQPLLENDLAHVQFATFREPSEKGVHRYGGISAGGTWGLSMICFGSLAY